MSASIKSLERCESMKANRQRAILHLISEQDVETQEQMRELLKCVGIRATQATISRDIKELNLIKQPAEDGRYRYTPSDGLPVRRAAAGRMQNIFKEGVTSCDSAQNLVVVRTMPGLAPAAGAALDGMELDGLVGSLAGDDTVLLIMRTNQAAERLCKELASMLERG